MSKSEPKSKSPSRARSRTASPAGKPRRETSRPRKRAGAGGLPPEISTAIAAALDKKAIDPVVLDLRKGSAFTDFFVILTGANMRQVHAIAEAVEEALRKSGLRPALVEGARKAEWVLIDYFDFVVHVFTSSTRDFYGLERLWGDAERVEVPAV